MGINVVWDNPEKTIVRADIVGRWGITDLNIALKRGLDMIDSLENDVDVIVNALQGDPPPLNLMSVLQKAVTEPTQRRYHVFVVGAHITTRVAMETLEKIHHFENKAAFVLTLAEARQLIAEERKRRTRV